MNLDAVKSWTQSSPQLPATVVTPSQRDATMGPAVLVAEYSFGVPWEAVRQRPWPTVVVLPHRFLDLPNDVAVFDAGHRFAALTAAARRLAIPPLPEPEIPAPWSAALDAVSLPGGSSPTAISTYPGGAASESTTDLADPVEEKAPTLADSDWFTYITAAVIGAGVAALLWQHIATGLAVGVLMIILLVATDQILGKDIPRDTS
ncbi:MAG TPA: hypothetical protein PLB21_07205 [Actinomycetota bacterium]|nr:hypothetical protein [Actinomycetota bacterium]